MSRFLPRIAQFTSHLAKPTTRASVSTTVPQFARKMAPIPASQKVVQITENGPSDVLKVSEAPVPQLKDDQILVRNEFAGVNYIDTYFRSGLYKTDFPLILGREAAGYVVASHPSVKGKFADGAKVVYMAEATYAQYTAVAAKDVIAIPDGVDTDVAVAAFLQGLTALTLVHEAADVQPDQWTYVAAAAGGVGSLLVQILGRLRAKVIASASTDEKLNTVAGLGKYPVKREHLLNSKSDDIVAKVQEITGGHGIDAVFDGIGKATFEDALKIVALKGNLVSFGNAVRLLNFFNGQWLKY